MPEPTKTNMKKSVTAKTVFFIVSCMVIAMAILVFSNLVTTPNRKNPYFSYGSVENTGTPVQVIDNNLTVVPFVFEIGPSILEVDLAFTGDHKQMPGIKMADAAVKVVNGKAASKVIIKFETKPILKAGTHFLTVEAKNPATGEILQTGTIPFTYNMHEVIGKCSC